MATEYLYDAIKAEAGVDFNICAVIVDDAGDALTEGCSLKLHDDNGVIATINGDYNGEMWSFDVPAETTEGLSGRYWYTVCQGDISLCFKTPLYLN